MTVPDNRPEPAVSVALRKPTQASFLRRFVQMRPTPCPRCRGDLRAIVVPRCPHCSLPVMLSLGSAEPYLAPWIALLPPLLMPGGIGIVMVIALVRAVSGNRVMPGSPFPEIAAYTILCLILSIAAVVGRRSFLVLPRTVQFLFTAAAWGVTLAAACYVWRRF